MNSNFLRLNKKDIINGLVMSIITPVIMVIYKTLETGSLNFDWKNLIAVAFAGGLGYVVKNFFSGEVTTLNRKSELIGTRPNDRGGKRG
jgi:hypothetical protein